MKRTHFSGVEGPHYGLSEQMVKMDEHNIKYSFPRDNFEVSLPLLLESGQSDIINRVT